MALSANLVWECNSSSGNDNNGGGFDSTVPNAGTNLSLSAVTVMSPLTINASNSSQITSGGTAFTPTHIGNVIAIGSSAGFTAGSYLILNVQAGIATLDRSVGTPGSTSGSGNLGGALASPSVAGFLMVGGNFTYIKNTGVNYSITSTSNGTAGGQVSPPSGSSQTQPCAFIGYKTNRTFMNTDPQPTINIAVNGGVAFNIMKSFNIVRNVKVTTSNAGTVTRAFFVSGNGVQYVLIENCIVSGVDNGIGLFGSGGNQYAINCYATGCATVGFQSGNQPPAGSIGFIGCVGDGCGTSGTVFSNFLAEIGGIYAYCLSINGKGVGFDQVTLNAPGVVWFQCSTFGNTHASNGYGWEFGSNAVLLINCLAFGDSIAGYRDNTNATPNYLSRFLAIGGSINTPTTIVNTTNLFSPVTVSVNPYNNSGGKDFSLNNTATGGAACRNAGMPTSYLGLTTANSPDIGAAEHTQISPRNCVMAVQDASYQNPVFSEPGRVVIAARGGVFGATTRKTITSVGSATTVGGSTGATLNISIPAGVQGQDLVIAIISSRTTDHTPVAVSAPPGTGWVQFFNFSTLSSGPNSLNLTGFYNFFNPLTGTTFTSSPTVANGFQQSAVVFAYRNVDQSQPIDVISSGVSTTGASASSVVSSSVTTLIDRDQIVVAAGDWDGGTFSASVPYNGGTSVSGSPGVGYQFRGSLFSPPASTGTITVTDSFGSGDPAQIASAITFALRPSPFILTPVDIYKRLLTEQLPPQAPFPGRTFSTHGYAPVTNTPYTRAVVASQVAPSPDTFPERGSTRSIVGFTPPAAVVPRTLISGFPDQVHQIVAQLHPGSTLSRSAITVPTIPYRSIIQPLNQSVPVFFPESGRALIGQVFPPVPQVKTPPPVFAVQVAPSPDTFPDRGSSYIYPAWWNKVPPYPNTFFARIPQNQVVENEGGIAVIGKVFPPVPIVPTPSPVSAKQVAPELFPEPGSSKVYPFGTELPPIPQQMPIVAMKGYQEYPHGQVEFGRAIIGQVFPAAPIVPYRIAVVADQTAPPQYDQGSAFVWPPQDIFNSVTSQFPFIPPPVIAQQVVPVPFPEDKPSVSVLGVVSYQYQPARSIYARQVGEDLIRQIDQGSSQFLGHGVVGVTVQTYIAAIHGRQIIPPFFPERGSAFIGAVPPQPPASPPPREVIARQEVPPPDTFPEPGRQIPGNVMPPAPFVSQFYAMQTTRVEPPMEPEPGSAFWFSQAYQYLPFQFQTQARETAPQPHPEPGRVVIGQVFPPVPFRPPPPPVVASQVVPIPSLIPEPGTAIYLGVGQSPPLHPMWVPVQFITAPVPNQPVHPEEGRSYIGAVVPPVPQIKTPPPVQAVAQVSPPFFPEEGRAFIWKTPPQAPPSPPPRGIIASVVSPDFVPEPGSTTSTHAYAPVPIVAPGFVTYPVTRVEAPFEPESGSAFCASAAPFPVVPIVATPPPVVAYQVTPPMEPEPGSELTFTILVGSPLLTPGRAITIKDLYTPTIRISGRVGG